MRLGGITADADLSPTTWTAAIQQAKQRGVKPLVSESGLCFRVPITNDVATYFIDEKYDARDAQSLTEAEIHGREQARAYVQAIRTIPGCEQAYILATGPEIGTRESRHVDAHYQVTTQDVENGAHFDDDARIAFRRFATVKRGIKPTLLNRVVCHAPGTSGELLYWRKRVRPLRDRRTLGSYAAAGQLQQRPSPAEGGLIKRHWWRFWQPRGAALPCNECGTVVRTVPVELAPAVMVEMAPTEICSARCTHCGALNTFPGSSAIEAFMCSECGEGVVVNRS
jgi:hypothetical protein